MSTNWRALQVPMDKNTKESPRQVGILPRYMSMGSFHADFSKGGKSRKLYKCTGTATVPGQK